jgi:hypothetical protein
MPEDDRKFKELTITILVQTEGRGSYDHDEQLTQILKAATEGTHIMLESLTDKWRRVQGTVASKGLAVRDLE